MPPSAAIAFIAAVPLMTHRLTVGPMSRRRLPAGPAATHSSAVTVHMGRSVGVFASASSRSVSSSQARSACRAALAVMSIPLR